MNQTFYQLTVACWCDSVRRETLPSSRTMTTSVPILPVCSSISGKNISAVHPSYFLHLAPCNCFLSLTYKAEYKGDLITRSRTLQKNILPKWQDCRNWNIQGSTLKDCKNQYCVCYRMSQMFLHFLPQVL